MKNKKHINDFNNISELENLSITELKKLEGTEYLINAMQALEKFIKEFEKIPIISTHYNWFIPPSMKISILKNIF